MAVLFPLYQWFTIQLAYWCNFHLTKTSEYLNKTDYELEYELKDAKIDDFSTFEGILNNFGINYRPSKRSKFKRFIDALEDKQ